MSAIIDNLDYNSRLPHLMEMRIPEQAPQNYNPERIVEAVLPILASVPVLSFGLQILAGTINSLGAMSVLRQIKGKTVENQVSCALHVASLTLLFFNPVAVSIIEQTRDIYHRTLNCKNNIVDGQYKNALIDTAFIAKNVVYIASVVTGGPNLILISIVSQGVFELYKSKQFYNKGMYLEASILTALAGLRCSAIAKTYKHEISDFVETFRTNLPG